MESEELAEATAALLEHFLDTGLNMQFCTSSGTYDLLSVYADDDGVLIFDIEAKDER